MKLTCVKLFLNTVFLVINAPSNERNPPRETYKIMFHFALGAFIEYGLCSLSSVISKDKKSAFEFKQAAAVSQSTFRHSTVPPEC